MSTENQKKKIESEVVKERLNASGGSAGAGGMNLHARVASVAAAYLLGKRRLDWLKNLEVDTPVEIYCETNGPGDDLRFVLANSLVVEAQSKKGLTRGEKLWEALDSIAIGIENRSIDYGVLIVDGAASATIRQELSQGIKRLGEGRTDSLNDITSEFKLRLETAGLSVCDVCSKLRIVVMHCSDHDDASEQVAKAELLRLCKTQQEAYCAWTEIQLAAHNLIENKGRWTFDTLLGILRAAQVDLQASTNENYSGLATSFAWEYLEETSPHGSYVRNFRQYYLVSDQSAANPFGGAKRNFIDWICGFMTQLLQTSFC